MTFDNRELLWKAYPQGYLAMRGIMTMGGWQCLGVAGLRSLWFPKLSEGQSAPIEGLPFGGPPYEQRSEWRPEMSMFRAAADLGELLPMINPRDPASWGCLLQDLANAAGWFDRNVTFHRCSGVLWTLFGVVSSDDYSTTYSKALRSWDFPTSDLAEAFVRARIALNEESR